MASPSASRARAAESALRGENYGIAIGVERLFCVTYH